MKALDDPDEAIRSAALAALGATVGPKDLAVLISAVVMRRMTADATIAEQALTAASIRMPDREATAAQLAAAMPSASTATQAQPAQDSRRDGRTEGLGDDRRCREERR